VKREKQQSFPFVARPTRKVPWESWGAYLRRIPKHDPAWVSLRVAALTNHELAQAIVDFEEEEQS